jgi:glycine cleavage system aminomethyltransferase T
MSAPAVKFRDIFKDVLGVGTHDAKVWLEIEQPKQTEGAVTAVYYSPADARAIAAALLEAAAVAEAKVQS